MQGNNCNYIIRICKSLITVFLHPTSHKKIVKIEKQEDEQNAVVQGFNSLRKSYNEIH